MARNPEFVVNYMEQIETLAEDVLTDKQQIIDLETKRNSNREALSALQKKTLAPPHSSTKTWVNFGGMFVKMKKDSAVSMLKSDQKELDTEIRNVQNGLHDKINKLRDAQGHPNLAGFDLNPLTPQELNQLKF